MCDVRKMYQKRLDSGEISEEDLNFIVSYKYKGKTQDEWLQKICKAEGFERDGKTPKWYRFMTNAIGADVLANCFLIGKKEKNETKKD
jgi:hypothetical protein